MKTAADGTATNTQIRFRVDGIPKGQGRPRAFIRGRHARVFNPKNADDWKAALYLTAQQHRPEQPIDGPVRMELDLFFPRPKRLCRKSDPAGPVPHTAKPDRDNAEKAVLDTLTQVGFWHDDAQVCAGEVRKWYHAIGERPGAAISIEPLIIKESALW